MKTIKKMKTKPFNLEEYLANPSRKVVTRIGYKVIIICTDKRGSMPIVALVEFETLDGVQIFYPDGKAETDRIYDLFFLDESEDELNEFEEELENFALTVGQIEQLAEINHMSYEDFYNKTIKDTSAKLLELARKQLHEEVVKSVEKYAHDKGYEQGKIDALKDLPKWKKFGVGIAGNCDRDVFLIRNDDGTYYTSKVLSSCCTYIELNELEKLPEEK